MRKQYHLRPAESGFDAWEINKLIESAKHLPVMAVDLNDIKELDENFWYQGANDIPSGRSIAAHYKLITEADLDYPILLSAERRVMDGMHRIIKALVLGRKTIDAVILEQTPPPDYRNVQLDELLY